VDDPEFDSWQGEDFSLQKRFILNLRRTTLSFPELKWMGRDGNPFSPFCARLRGLDRGNFMFFIFILGDECRLTSSKIFHCTCPHLNIFSCTVLLQSSKNGQELFALHWLSFHNNLQLSFI
jgi:hypothetical protein